MCGGGQQHLQPPSVYLQLFFIKEGDYEDMEGLQRG